MKRAGALWKRGTGRGQQWCACLGSGQYTSRRASIGRASRACALCERVSERGGWSCMRGSLHIGESGSFLECAGSEYFL